MAPIWLPSRESLGAFPHSLLTSKPDSTNLLFNMGGGFSRAPQKIHLAHLKHGRFPPKQRGTSIYKWQCSGA